VALTKELDEKVFQPAQVAQEFVESYKLHDKNVWCLGSRHNGQGLLFRTQPQCPDASNIHTATGKPSCVVGQGPVAIDIRVDATGQMLTVPATPSCFGWTPTGEFTVPAFSRATALTSRSWGFASQEARVLKRSENGTFVEEVIAEVVLLADSLVVSQTVPGYFRPDSAAMTRLVIGKWSLVFMVTTFCLFTRKHDRGNLEQRQDGNETPRLSIYEKFII
jgi:hypothetical protein